ncbi:MAG: Coq4 family protein [Pseudomonadota bacterium]
MGESFVARVAEMSHRYAGVTEAAARPLPEQIKLETLAAQPPGSLGRQFHDLIVDNTFDLEVLDRDALGLSGLPKPLDYLNTRILQAHDLWHITAGYETTALHEIAISGFQMAQFGHNYSAQFLSVTAAVGALSPAYGYKILMDTITSAWVHGRETPPLIAIQWEEVWDKPTDKIRRDHGVTPYQRPYPANLIERSRPVADLVGKVSRAMGAVARPFRRAQA